MTKARLCLVVILWISLAGCGGQNDLGKSESDIVVLSVVGTNDVHGELLSSRRKGGLTTFSGYVAALRAAREEDGGAMLLIDAGDMWQGTLESNLTEGAAVVEAFNALGYAAAAVGNHEFDFGEMIHEIIAIAEPYQPKCQKSCKGLCKSCGVNLNKALCSCAAHKSSKISTFSVLKELKLH